MARMSNKEFENEHRRLIRILESGSAADRTKEAENQAAELREHLKKYVIRRKSSEATQSIAGKDKDE